MDQDRGKISSQHTMQTGRSNSAKTQLPAQKNTMAAHWKHWRDKHGTRRLSLPPAALVRFCEAARVLRSPGLTLLVLALSEVTIGLTGWAGRATAWDKGAKVATRRIRR